MEIQKMEAAFRISSLITRYLKGGLTAEQEQQLAAWIAAGENNRLLFETLTSAPLLDELLEDFSKINKRKKAAHKKVSRRLFPTNGKVHMFAERLWRYVA